jgi:hypothetical protein
MTTHDQQVDVDYSPETSDLTSEPAIETHDHSLQQDEFRAPNEQNEYQAPTETVPVHAEPSAEPSTEKALFANDELSDLQSRWAEVQAAFVDDPRESVHKADGLVSDVVEHITTNFSQARSHLEEQWGRGEDVSTEDLRVALRSYREFFQRLLAVT